LISREPLRVVFDTNIVLSAMLFRSGRLATLREHWHSGEVTPLASSATVAEFRRILAYAKFGLQDLYQLEALAYYISACTMLDPAVPCPLQCRDPKDQAFLDLAQSGRADIIVSGDGDLLALAGQTDFVIEKPEDYLRRVSGAKREN
jgi:putative PIN family toxin of toxin-antitoxin system